MPEVVDVTTLLISRLLIWQHAQQVRQYFWTPWHKKCLSSFAIRRKWHVNTPITIKYGSLVILRENNVSPILWPLERSANIHPGTDNISRTPSRYPAERTSEAPTHSYLLPLESDVT